MDVFIVSIVLVLVRASLEETASHHICRCGNAFMRAVCMCARLCVGVYALMRARGVYERSMCVCENT